MLVALPIMDTEQNGRSVLTERVLENLLANVVRDTDRVIAADNGSCAETLHIYEILCRKYKNFSVIYNGKNLGIAGGANVAWHTATPDEIVVKMDNDCVILTPGWPELVDYVFSKDSNIGILGLKRKDCAESPTAPEPSYKSTLSYISHKPGERWIVIEEVNHAMGTCYAFNPQMRKKFGYLSQPGSVYGFDDSLAAARAHKLGYKVCFLPQIEIDHIDPPGQKSNDPYVQWKLLQAGQYMNAFYNMQQGIKNGTISPYFDGGFPND